MKPTRLLPLILILCTPALADDVPATVTSFDPAVFAAVKAKLNDPALKPALDELTRQADAALKVKPSSVMDKPEVPAGIDAHDYVSYAPYFWPNPDTKDGLPFVRHDGKRNREQMA